MNLVIDWGNSSLKTGWFDGTLLADTGRYESSESFLTDLRKRQPEFRHPEQVLVSSTSRSADEIRSLLTGLSSSIGVLDGQTPVPLRKDYDTPNTLGTDRVAAAVGAISLFPGQACLVFDLGTCLTADLVDHTAVFRGGLISPGLRMRFRAMHEQTARLPLVDVPEKWPDLTAKNTRHAMQSGVVNGMAFEMTGIIDAYRHDWPDLAVLVCGGDAPVFESRLKQPIFAVPELVLVGLNRILRYNVENLHADKPGTIY
ncbi:type III pantothenate kinase [Spirosoma endbachense]|uniref:Type III pantothenate kinase n=1 Tax=Spirosoma endbachense TaxID=2666025 RepID=A0A6P1VPP5_9BACT|nr:type III pantothenate kinase [Spirosoma endbachense]QHV94675.1 type III pantothenate kinase [Spirosoma endbachense]